MGIDVGISVRLLEKHHKCLMKIISVCVKLSLGLPWKKIKTWYFDLRKTLCSLSNNQSLICHPCVGACDHDLCYLWAHVLFWRHMWRMRDYWCYQFPWKDDMFLYFCLCLWMFGSVMWGKKNFSNFIANISIKCTLMFTISFQAL